MADLQETVRLSDKARIAPQELLNWLSALNFHPLEGEVGVYRKHYDGPISITVDTGAGTILYPNEIRTHHMAASNVSKRENLVVLECIDRLLRKGYDANKIELEKGWKLGHKGKGRLDILVRDGANAPFLMIECKTWGKEYSKERQKMYQDGGQLFSYYIQERATKYLCLYSSTANGARVEYVNDIVQLSSDFDACTDTFEVFEHWDKTFQTKGLFDDDIPPYKPEFKGLIYTDLQDLEHNSSSVIFNQFAEILRRNVVSDKSNAFNKIFNLFICKIVDEDFKDGSGKEVEFQWKGSDTYTSFFDRLNNLYKRGAKDYINIDVEDLSIDQLNNLLERAPKTDKIRDEFIKLRLYKNTEFAFKEVYNKNTFEENASIVKEVVQLLQPYRLKYNQKQQFLGDFFELLLSTGFKQEVGQYFTPLPLARFICKSLPVDQIIDRKNNKEEKFFLPYIIDYASGSGHFLTEMMDEIDQRVKNIANNEAYIKGPKAAKDEFESHRHSYKWTKEYVYGIEKDYRLAKTTKINTFLNGDGDANIIMGDGLDNFEKSRTYRGMRKLEDIRTGDEGTFDIVVANPPYSVSEFKNTLNAGKETFSLYPYISDKSGNIECCFVERTQQLLCDGGVAGIILPVSFLTSSETLNVKTRDFLFKNFLIKACVYLGEKTFMATNVYSIVLFLEKRHAQDIEAIERIIDRFFVDYQDVTCNGIENAFSRYATYAYGALGFDEYVGFMKSPHRNDSMSPAASEAFREYIEEDLPYSHIVELEKIKLLHFAISYKQQVVIVDAGSGNKELEFLGYEFSKRRGNEGIKLRRSKDGELASKLYSTKDPRDERKVSSYILRSFEGSLPDSVSEDIRDHVEIIDMCDLFDFSRHVFDNSVRYGIQHTKFHDRPTVKLKHFFDAINGVTYKKPDQERFETSKRVLTSTHIDLQEGGYKLEKPIYLSESFDLPQQSRLKKNDLFISTSNSLKHLGKVAFIDRDMNYWAGGFCTILRPKEQYKGEAEEISLYVRDILQKSPEFRAFINLYKNSRISNIGTSLMEFRIPVPKNIDL